VYHHIEGELVVLSPTRAVVDAGGIGYECRIPLSTFSALKGKERTRVRLLTHLHVLEDDLRLYGFASERERDLFRLITSISGVGPGIGFAVLASFDPAGFAGAIASGDAKSLQKIKGVGAKLSERMILELKDRAAALAALAGGDGASGSPSGGAAGSRVVQDAIALLETLGYAAREARERVEAALRKLRPQGASPGGDGGPELTVEALAQAAMRTR
jgi:holliday junction DNA helicase RuvA